jgi:hypothetical protein
VRDAQGPGARYGPGAFILREAFGAYLVVLIARIGQDLRARYQVPKELPPKLLALLVKLDAIEGNCSLRYAPPLERRSVGESDWLPPRFVWQNDIDLFGG